jgi:hypothetical protein
LSSRPDGRFYNNAFTHHNNISKYNHIFLLLFHQSYLNPSLTHPHEFALTNITPIGAFRGLGRHPLDTTTLRTETAIASGHADTHASRIKGEGGRWRDR